MIRDPLAIAGAEPFDVPEQVAIARRGFPDHRAAAGLGVVHHHVDVKTSVVDAAMSTFPKKNATRMAANL